MKINSKKFTNYVKENNLKIYEEQVGKWFDDLLDDVYPKFLNSYLPSSTYKAIDPVGYRTELSYYIDALIKDGTLIEFEDGYIETEKIRE